MPNKLAVISIAMLMNIIAGCSLAPKKPDAPTVGDYDYAKKRIEWLVHGKIARTQGDGAQYHAGGRSEDYFLRDMVMPTR